MSKTLYWFSSVVLLSMVVVKIITVTVSYLTATMIKNSTEEGSVCQLIVVLIWRTTPMDPKILGLCPNKVSQGSKYKLLMVGSHSALGEEGTVGCARSKRLQTSMLMVCCLHY